MAENGFRLTGDFGFTAAGLTSTGVSVSSVTALASGLLVVVVGLRLRFGAEWIIFKFHK